jgi:hypothetical protein
LTLDAYVGRSPDSLTWKERAHLAGKWIALERYTPRNLAMRLIAAIGDSPVDCIRFLRSHGRDPEAYEFVPLHSLR